MKTCIALALVLATLAGGCAGFGQTTCLERRECLPQAEANAFGLETELDGLPAGWKLWWLGPEFESELYDDPLMSRGHFNVRYASVSVLTEARRAAHAPYADPHRISRSTTYLVRPRRIDGQWVSVVWWEKSARYHFDVGPTAAFRKRVLAALRPVDRADIPEY